MPSTDPPTHKYQRYYFTPYLPAPAAYALAICLMVLDVLPPKVLDKDDGMDPREQYKDSSAGGGVCVCVCGGAIAI